MQALATYPRQQRWLTRQDFSTRLNVQCMPGSIMWWSYIHGFMEWTFALSKAPNMQSHNYDDMMHLMRCNRIVGVWFILHLPYCLFSTAMAPKWAEVNIAVKELVPVTLLHWKSCYLATLWGYHASNSWDLHIHQESVLGLLWLVTDS